LKILLDKQKKEVGIKKKLNTQKKIQTRSKQRSKKHEARDLSEIERLLISKVFYIFVKASRSWFITTSNAAKF
jgi:hypothetical protein